jgi:Zn-dependent M32 family carboxypeptidase
MPFPFLFNLFFFFFFLSGSLYDSPDKLLTVITGKPLDPSIYIQYIQGKYNALYSL